MDENQPVLDQAAFQQVWRRVMPEDRPDCPFTLDPPAPQAPVPVQPPLLPPAVSARPPMCLGEASAGELPTLELLLKLTLEDWQVYRALSRRHSSARGPAETKARHAKRLRAACFLISGQRRLLTAPPFRSSQPLPQVLRTRFQAEQQLALRFFTAADTAADPCLIDLYRALGRECQDLAGDLRTWVEGL